jgi:hypothetical protein
MAIKISGVTVVSDTRSLSSITSLDAQTINTIETAIAVGPNTMTDVQVSGISTFLSGPVLIGGGATTGITSTVLQVVGVNSSVYIGGNLGINSTIPGARLTITGDANVTGVITASTFNGNFNGGATGVGTFTVITSPVGSSGTVTINSNLYVSGTVSVAGTTFLLNAAQLQVKDKDIILGFTTDASNNEVSNDSTANHGGISIASTVGGPLFDMPSAAGFNSNPFTYKQFMWISSANASSTNGYTGVATDAWISNYAIGIGTLTVRNNSRLTVGAGFTVFDTILDATDIKARNLNVTGISTVTNIAGTRIDYPTAFHNLGIVTTAFGTRIDYPQAFHNLGIVTTAGITSAFVNTGVVTAISGTNLSYTGVSTITNAAGSRIDYPIAFHNLGILTTGSIARANINTGVVTAISGLNLSYTGVSTFTAAAGPVLIGGGTTTTTSGQILQVTGINSSVYIGGSVGIGTTLPGSTKLYVSGTGVISGITTIGVPGVTGTILNPTSDIFSVSVGLSALTNASVPNAYNSAFGSGALTTVNLGSFNSAFGFNAGTSLGNDSWNSVFGFSSLQSPTGSNNSVFGANALQAGGGLVNSTNAFGFGAFPLLGGSNPTAYSISNSGFGDNVGAALTFGNLNTLIGSNAAGNLISGDYNVVLGAYAGIAISTGSNQLAIGNYSGAWIYGNNAYNVGIGTTIPTSKFTVFGDTGITGVVTATTFSGNLNSGVGTVTNISGTRIDYPIAFHNLGIVTTAGITSAFINTGIITAISGTNLNYSGVSTITNAAGSRLDYPIAFHNLGILTTGSIARANINTGVVTAISGLNLSYTGVSSFTAAAGPVLVGGGTSTGTTGQVLQVTGINSSVYIGGSVGIGTTIAGSTLQVNRSTSGTAIRAFSGATGNNVSYSLGRISDEIFLSIAGAANNFLSGSAAGDFTLNNNTGKLMFGASSNPAVTIDTSNNFVIGTTVSNGTGSQPLQVGSTLVPLGAYVSGSVGIGSTIATSKLSIGGDALVTGVITAYTFSGNINSGFSTVTSISGSRLDYPVIYNNLGIVTTLSTTNAFINLGIVTTVSSSTANINTGVVTAISGTNLSYTGVSTITNAAGSRLDYPLIFNNLGIVTTASITSAFVNTGVVTAISGTNLSYTGVSTITNAAGTRLDYPIAFHNLGIVTTAGITSAFVNTGVVTAISGTNLSYGGIGTVTTIFGTRIDYPQAFHNLGILTTGSIFTANINTGVVTAISGTNLNYSGISTFSTVLVGSAASTGTALQGLQVGSATSTIGAYISGNVGIGTTITTSGAVKLNIVGATAISGINTTFTITQNLAKFLILSTQTTAGTATTLTSDGSNIPSSTGNVHLIPANAAITFKGSLVANVTGGGNSRAWEFKGLIKRGAASSSTTLVGTPIINDIAFDAGASTWGISIGADTNIGAIAVNVTGQAATTIRWVCKMESAEVTY